MTKEKAIKFAGISEYLNPDLHGLKSRVEKSVATMTETEMEMVNTISDIIELGAKEHTF